MPVYGGKRHDFVPPTYNLALLESWPLRWAIEDENGTALSSFAGLSDWGFLLLDRLDSANGWTAALAAALLSQTGAQISASVPNVDVVVTAAEQAAVTGGLSVRPYAYELWVNTAGDPRRVAYGTIGLLA